MSLQIMFRFYFLFLVYTEKFNPTIHATKVDVWDQINTTAKRTSASTFSFSSLCQDQMVKVQSKIYHLDRLRWSLKSAYFEKLFTSDDFHQKNIPVLEIQSPNSEVFSAVVDLIHGKEISEVLSKENYFPLLEAMDQLEMEIDLKTVSNFMEHNLTSYSLQEVKMFELYTFIRKNSKFEYLLENVFKHFANNLTTLRNHTIFLSLPLDHLIQIINKVESLDDNKRHKIIQMCSEWLCHDMENRLFHLANLVFSIKPAFNSLAKKTTGLLKGLPKCNVDKKTKRKIISRCLFALLAGKKLDFRNLDELNPVNNLKSFYPLDAAMFKLYNSIKNNSKPEYVFESVFKYFADNLMTLQNHKIFPSLPQDHLIQIIKRVQDPTDEKKYEIIQMFTEWLCYDMENRLPHLVNLVTSAKSLFLFSIETNNPDSIKCLPKCHVDQSAKRKIISKCLFALLVEGEQLSLKTLAYDKLNYHNDVEYNSNDDEQESCHSGMQRFVNLNDEYAKLKKFLNNGDFYDIKVRAGEKTFKLHRVILESRSGYFKKIFHTEYAEAAARCHGTPSCPSKNKEYLLDDEIEPSVLDEMINYIYFGKYDPNRWSKLNETILVFKTVDSLEVQGGKLFENCKRNLISHHDEVGSEEIVQILNYAHGKTKHDDLYLLYLSKHMTAKWPEIYNVSHFCSISWTMLENMLKSPHFNLINLGSDKIMDICSKWIVHDVKNRFNFLPQIAKIINPLYVITDHDKFTIKAATNLNNCSQQWVQNELLHELQTSLPYIVHSKNLSENSSRRLKLEEIPVFIAPRNEETIDILNFNLDEIATLHFPGSKIPKESGYRQSPLSAAMIHDNLFILCSSWQTVFFEVFNLSSKKRFSLAIDARLNSSLFDPPIFSLLNCNNEIYYCNADGSIMKYLVLMNHWENISNDDKSNKKKQLRFASDGETIYRMYAVSEKYYTLTCVVEKYDFKQKLWNSIPNLPMVYDVFTRHAKLTVINDRDLAVPSRGSVILLDPDSNKWITNRIPYEMRSFYITTFTQCEDRMLLVVDNELYQLFSSNEIKKWELKKKLPLMNNFTEKKFENFRYQSIAAVHRPRLLH